MSLRSPLARVRGLGSAREGSSHWWAQRLTSLALVPLVLWFVFSVAMMAGADYVEFIDWVHSPVVAGLLVLLISVGLLHSNQGMQVVIEDYIHGEFCKVVALFLSQSVHIVLGLTGVLSVLMILFRG
ncbi:succinate dehydrogenase, hydrophobic membrane anchor protein [Kiloniella laminariae]|uniref:succinate dehydrogenase, hydrophobic membrane anchor protein n=1 Tax=Kiloniella laminariae TaxID=454162 RepID=UPI0003764DBA|nr:succinate dehydrogenase, hydrophobic membrane anchor protein [Kiloniella laminariae]